MLLKSPYGAGPEGVNCPNCGTNRRFIAGDYEPCRVCDRGPRDDNDEIHESDDLDMIGQIQLLEEIVDAGTRPDLAFEDRVARISAGYKRLKRTG